MTINTNNYEAYFLLYIDRELSDDERQMVESFVRQHPDPEKELETLKQTIAIPPVLVFENKDSLLREEKKRSLYPIYWMRIAATLLILLAGAWILFMAAINQPAVKVKNPVPSTVADQHPASIANPESVTAASGANTNPGSAKTTKTALNPNPQSVNRAANAATMHATAATNHTASAQNRKPGMLYVKQKQAGQHKQNTKIQGIQDQRTDEETAIARPSLPQTALNLPEVAQQKEMPETNPSIINHQPSTILPSTNNPASLRQPTYASLRRPKPSTDSTSILIFDNILKPVTGFFKKLTTWSSGADVTADNLRRKVRVSVFQFSLNK
jgi:hypothetical protein